MKPYGFTGDALPPDKSVHGRKETGKDDPSAQAAWKQGTAGRVIHYVNNRRSAAALDIGGAYAVCSVGCSAFLCMHIWHPCLI